MLQMDWHFLRDFSIAIQYYLIPIYVRRTHIL